MAAFAQLSDPASDMVRLAGYVSMQLSVQFLPILA
jgi:hypothetical protein